MPWFVPFIIVALCLVLVAIGVVIFRYLEGYYTDSQEHTKPNSPCEIVEVCRRYNKNVDNWLSRLIKRKNKMVLDKEAEPEVKHRSSASYVMLFETGQYGRYYVVSGKEANLFRIHLLPEGVEVKKDLFPEVCPHKDAVLVYGEIRRGSCFSLEGWLHEGPWVEDFEKFADEQEAKIRKKKAEEDARLKEQKKIQDDHDQQLLALYSSNWKPTN